MKKVTVFGSTGSIGKAALDVIEHLKSDYSVYALAAKTNYRLLAEQVCKTRPKIAVTGDEKTKEQLYKSLKNTASRNITILTGVNGLSQIATDQKTDILVIAMSGTMGIIPLIKAIEKKKRIALSTKELLVSFGSIIMQKAKQHGTEILPIDSELVGLHQCLDKRNTNEIKRVIITASGGPFRNYQDFTNISVNQVLKHPIWKMGKKNTVDSATLANKGLEVIETARLFSVPVQKIEVLIHPQSIIHAMVEFVDNSVLAQLALPDMRACIQYALTFPKREQSIIKQLDLTECHQLEFYKPNANRFPALNLAYQALKTDGIAPCIFNAANEVAVEQFLNKKIDFNDIPVMIRKSLCSMPKVKNPNLQTLLKYETLTKKYARGLV